MSREEVSGEKDADITDGMQVQTYRQLIDFKEN
jgi:hypothetical protein